MHLALLQREVCTFLPQLHTPSRHLSLLFMRVVVFTFVWNEDAPEYIHELAR